MNVIKARLFESTWIEGPLPSFLLNACGNITHFASFCSLFSHSPFRRQFANRYERGSSNVQAARFWPLSCKTHGHASIFLSSVWLSAGRLHLKCDGTRWRTGGEVKGKLSNWVASTLHTTSEHGVSSITTADAHTSAASSRLNWRPPGRFKRTRSFRRKTKSGFCVFAITFQLASTSSDARMRPCLSDYTFGQNTYGWTFWNSWRIKNQLRCHLLFYCTSYRLNMFRALLCPSSGTRDCNVDYHIGRFVL